MISSQQSMTGKCMIQMQIFHFTSTSGEIRNNSAFRESDIKDEVWVDFANIICILPAPSETKEGRKFDEAVITNLRERFNIWKKKN